ncbi:MAG: hypothetical protein WD425_07920 [Nitrospirales bacterium]
MEVPTVTELNDLFTHARPEVRGLLQREHGVFLATAQGMYRLGATGHANAIPGWEGKDIVAIGPADGQAFVAFERVNGDERRDRIHYSDSQDGPGFALPPPAGLHVRAVWGQGLLLAGGTHGLFRWTGESWIQCWPEAGYDGSAEIHAIDRDADGAFHAYIKKHGPGDQPAVLTSMDEGRSWILDWIRPYHDQVHIVRGNRAITRWCGLIEHDRPLKRLHKQPIQAGMIYPDGTVAVLDGPKLILTCPNGLEVAVSHPWFADAEHLALGDNEFTIAGEQGAWHVELATRRLTDCFSSLPVSSRSAKIKKLWALEGQTVVATTSFNTHRSEDGGLTWQPCTGDWLHLDAEGLVSAGNGIHYMVCQRGLMVSRDGGRQWRHVKLNTYPHHFNEFTAAVRCGEYLVLGSKAGCFSSPLSEGKPGHYLLIAGHVPISALIVRNGLVIAATAKGELIEVNPANGNGRHLTTMSRACEALAVLNGFLYAASEEALYEIKDDGSASAASVPTNQPFAIYGLADRLLLYTSRQAWQGSPSTGWKEIPSWPTAAPIKHATVLGDGTILGTDRRSVHRISLQDCP